MLSYGPISLQLLQGMVLNRKKALLRQEGMNLEVVTEGSMRQKNQEEKPTFS